MLSSKQEAVELAGVARAAGAIAAQAGNRKWIEIRGTIPEVDEALYEFARAAGVTRFALWDPQQAVGRIIDVTGQRSAQLPEEHRRTI